MEDAIYYEVWMWPLAAVLALLWLGLMRWQRRAVPDAVDITENRGCCWWAVMGAMIFTLAVGKTWWMCAIIVAMGIVGCVRFTDHEDLGGQ